MLGRRTSTRGNKRRDSGFSLTEVAVALAVGLILMAVAMPSFLRAYHAYQLSYAAGQVVDIVRLTRYEAIRRNKPLICVFQPSSADPTMTSASMTDTLGNALTGVSSSTILLGASGNLANSVPGSSSLPTQANLGSIALMVVPAGSKAQLTFDARGALTSGNVMVFYLASGTAPDAGYRAVLLTPAGSLQIWTGDGTGNWQQMR